MVSAPAGREYDLPSVLRLLDLERVGEQPEDGRCGAERFVARHPDRVGFSRTFGGQLLAQSLIAAARTVGGPQHVHSTQTHFIRGGDPKRDLDITVERLRDGRSFANRRVDVAQDGSVVCTMLAAFSESGSGLEHGPAAPAVPPPAELPVFDEALAGYEESLPAFAGALHPIDLRYANDPPWVQKGTGESRTDNRVWMRPAGAIPDAPCLHAALLAYASDMTVLDSVLTRHGLSWGLDRVLAATLNHSLWFHRPARFDRWLLYVSTSPVATASRGTGSGTFFDADGAPVASSVQEGVVRHFPPRAARRV